MSSAVSRRGLGKPPTPAKGISTPSHFSNHKRKIQLESKGKEMFMMEQLQNNRHDFNQRNLYHSASEDPAKLKYLVAGIFDNVPSGKINDPKIQGLEQIVEIGDME